MMANEAQASQAHQMQSLQKQQQMAQQKQNGSQVTPIIGGTFESPVKYKRDDDKHNLKMKIRTTRLYRKQILGPLIRTILSL